MATVVLVAVVGAGLARRANDRDTGPVSLAVLPFDRLGDSATTNYLAVGLSDGIGTALSAASQRGRAQLHDHVDLPREHQVPQQIGAEQQVSAVLRGSVQRLDDRVRVEAQLLRIRGRTSGSGLTVRATASEVPEIQRDIVRGNRGDTADPSDQGASETCWAPRDD